MSGRVTLVLCALTFVGWHALNSQLARDGVGQDSAPVLAGQEQNPVPHDLPRAARTAGVPPTTHEQCTERDGILARLSVVSDSPSPASMPPVAVPLSGQLVLTLVVEAPLGVEVAVVPLITIANAWRQRDAVTGWETTRLGAGRVRRQQVYRLSPWQGGDVPLEPVPVRFRQSGQLEWDEISWKPVPVVVSSVVQDADVRGARAITGVEEVPAPEPTASSRAAVGLGLIVSALALVGWLGWRLRRRTATPASPNDWALTELASLGRVPPRGIHFHSHLAEVVRRYVELRFGIPAQRQTTAEFLEAARQAPWLTPSQQRALRELLTQCDLVKFARCVPGPDECGAALSRARGFVEETR